MTDLWTFAISIIEVSTLFSNKLDHCLVSCLFSSNFVIEILFNSFKFCWSSTICFPCSLMASTNLSVVLTISLSSATSSIRPFNCSFDSFAFSSTNFFRQSSFNFKQLSHKWKPRSSAAILDSQLASFALLGLGIIFDFENYEEYFLKS